MKQKPKAYIGGPMRGHPNLNFAGFDKAKKEVEAMGYVAISPADMDRVHEGWGKLPPARFQARPRMIFECMRRDALAILELVPSRGDVIYLQRGWETSSGTIAERALAMAVKLKVLYQKGAATEVTV
jgi:hypothetical protein